MKNNEIISLYPVDSVKTVTLTNGQWSAIRTAVLCLAADERLAGKETDADYYLAAYKALKEAMA